MNLIDRGLVELHRPVIARYCQPVAEIPGSFRPAHRLEVITHCYPLGQLPQGRPAEFGAEFRLAEKNDLAQVVLVVGNIPIGGFGEDGDVVIEPAAEIQAVTVGADGLTVASKMNNTVKLSGSGVRPSLRQ